MSGQPSILQVVPYFPPDTIGGVGEVAFHLHQSLLNLGYKSTVMTTGTSPDTDNVVRLCRRPALFPMRLAAARGLIKKHDILHVHHGECLGALVLSRFLRKPSLCTIHCSCLGIARSLRPYKIGDHTFGGDWRSFVQRRMTNPIRYGLDRISMALATKTNFISRFGAEEFHRPGDDEHVVYNGIPDPPPISRPQEILETDLLYVGTGNHRKRVNMLPFVLREVQSRLNRPVSLRTVGFDRRSWPEMFHIADELGVTESIVCEGPMTSAKVQGFYAKSKLLIVPSAYEGLPLVIGEAQKAGLPCVATNVCAHPEIIVPEENGLLVPLDSVEGFAAAVCRLLSDEPLRQSMAKAAVARSRELFSLERQVELYCRLYDSLSRSFEDNARSQGRALADVEN